MLHSRQRQRRMRPIAGLIFDRPEISTARRRGGDEGCYLGVWRRFQAGTQLERRMEGDRATHLRRSSGSHPGCGLIFDAGGNLYGTTQGDASQPLVRCLRSRRSWPPANSPLARAIINLLTLGRPGVQGLSPSSTIQRRRMKSRPKGTSTSDLF